MPLGEESLAEMSLGETKATLVARQVVSLSAGNPILTTTKIAVPANMATLAFQMRFPTTAIPQGWDATSVVRITLTVSADGVEHRAVNEVVGGIHTDVAGVEMPFYSLLYHPTTHYISGMPVRVCQNTTTERSAYVTLERLSGSIETEIVLAEATEALQPTWTI